MADSSYYGGGRADNNSILSSNGGFPSSGQNSSSNVGSIGSMGKNGGINNHPGSFVSRGSNKYNNNSGMMSGGGAGGAVKSTYVSNKGYNNNNKFNSNGMHGHLNHNNNNNNNSHTNPDGVIKASKAADHSKIFVGGLSWQTTEESLRWHFEQYGQVTSVEVMKDRNTGDPRGFAFVVFADPATLDLVMADVDKHEINHKLVDVKRAQARGIAPPSIHEKQAAAAAAAALAGIPYSSPSDPAGVVVKKEFGTSSVLYNSGPNNNVGPSVGHVGHVGHAAIKHQQYQPSSGPTNTNFNTNANPIASAAHTTSTANTNATAINSGVELTPEQLQTKVFVGGIPPAIDRDELKALFSVYGPVVDSIVMVDQLTQRSRCFGFVTFETGSDGAQKAIAAQPITIQGRQVEVKLATPRAEQAQQPGGGGGNNAAQPSSHHHHHSSTYHHNNNNNNHGAHNSGTSSLGSLYGGNHHIGLGANATMNMNNKQRVIPASGHLGLRAGKQSLTITSSEFAGLAVAYGRSGWKAGYGTKAFGKAGWAVEGWEDVGVPPPEKAGFSFEMLRPPTPVAATTATTSTDANKRLRTS